jgi:hypothetical protein
VYQQQAEIRGKVDVRKGGFGEKEKSVEDKAPRVCLSSATVPVMRAQSFAGKSCMLCGALGSHKLKCLGSAIGLCCLRKGPAVGLAVGLSQHLDNECCSSCAAALCRCHQAASQLIKGMLQLLKENKDLLVRKRLYIELGCRGDWPEVRIGGWGLPHSRSGDEGGGVGAWGIGFALQ